MKFNSDKDEFDSYYLDIPEKTAQIVENSCSCVHAGPWSHVIPMQLLEGSYAWFNAVLLQSWSF